MRSASESDMNLESNAVTAGGVDLDRRGFIKLTGWGAAGLFFSTLPPVAGPFTGEDFTRLVPADKKLSADWIRSLYERGRPDVRQGADLRWIGMPVGGVGAGQLYLGGDGRLWLWDIFNQAPRPDFGDYSGPHYAKPMKPFAPIQQGFAVRVAGEGRHESRTLDSEGFPGVTFLGQYPIGEVTYQANDFPVRVRLQAFSPFIPLDLADSELPATVMQFTVENTGRQRVEVELAGWLENAVCLGSGRPGRGERRNSVLRERGQTLLQAIAVPAPPPPARPARPDVLFEGFEHETYGSWRATGTAFGDGPMERSRMPSYQGEVGAQGERLVNSHNARQGEDVAGADRHTGTLTSRAFVVERDYINFLIGGGAHRDRTCLNLRVDGRTVLSATGENDNRMQRRSFDVRRWVGQEAELQIVDEETGAWGNIGVDDIVFSDRAAKPDPTLEQEEDFGSMGMALLGGGGQVTALPRVNAPVGVASVFGAEPGKEPMASAPFGETLVGALRQGWVLAPGEKATATFLVTWHFPALRRASLNHVAGIEKLSRSYARRFGSASAVARFVARDFDRLARETRLWRDTWYDSTLPYWFLDRTFLNLSIGATATCLHFDNGRFYGWEGTYCCAGTCQHVWQYAQGLARVFPELERSARELTDYGIAFHEETGALDYRAEAHRVVAIDGQAGTILRVYREHQMTADDGFLRRVWPRVKKSIEYLIRQDGNGDGVLEGEQYNTLDASWYGVIAWLSSLYLAALRAGSAMAEEMGDTAFARECSAVADRGGARLTERVFNGEYYYQVPDPSHPESINTNDGCHIDQVYGQSWAFQVGLPRVLPEGPTRSALEALWRYNFTPDVGVYRERFEAIKNGRWYAMPGEGGLLMCTWPRGGAEKSPGKGDATFVGYFNECMTGFEYQVAGHMIWERLVEPGLAITRMIHDRYHPAKRNPWNEVECSSHYARAMASYGVFLAACGFTNHGPKGEIGFAPRLSPEKFRAAFTTAGGWGTFDQERAGGVQRDTLSVRWGQVRLRRLTFEIPEGAAVGQVRVKAGRRTVRAAHTVSGRAVAVELGREVVLRAGEQLTVWLEKMATSGRSSAG